MALNDIKQIQFSPEQVEAMARFLLALEDLGARYEVSNASGNCSGWFVEVLGRN